MNKKNLFLPGTVLLLALVFVVTGVTTTGIALANDGCQMTVSLPLELQTVGATVDINHGPQGLTHGQPFDVISGQNFQWRLNVNGFTSGWKTVTGACDGTLQVTEDDWCDVSIDLGDLQGTDATVDISHGPQDMTHGQSVILPTSINIQWRLTVNGFTSGWKTKHVDCTPIKVEADDWCDVSVDLGGLQGTDVTVDISHGPQDMTHGQSVILPTSINIQWRLTVNGFTSGWKTKHVDCTPIKVEADDWCDVSVDLGGLQGTDATVDISHGPQDMTHGQSVILPTSINIQWRLTVNGFTSGWKTKHVDCSNLVVGPDDYKELTFKFGWTSDWKYHKTQINHGPLVDNGGSVILPTGINIQVVPVFYGHSLGGWRTMTIDCTWNTLTWQLVPVFSEQEPI